MLVSQALVVDVPASEDIIIRIPDATPFPRALFLQNQSSSNTLIIRIESSNDGGSTWTQVGDEEVILAGSVVGRWLVSAGPYLRLQGAGNGRLYVGLARFYVPSDGILPLVSL